MSATASRWRTLSKDPVGTDSALLNRPQSGVSRGRASDYDNAKPIASSKKDDDEQSDMPVEYEAAPAWQQRLKNNKTVAMDAS